MATAEKVAGVIGLFVIAYIIISSVVSLFRPSPVPTYDTPSVGDSPDSSVITAPGQSVRTGTAESGKTKSAILEIVETVVMTILIFAAVRLMVQNFRIEGNSMEPNLHNGQYLIIEKISYRFSEPNRGDVIVFHYPSNPKRDFIKRIIGLPGEQVTIDRGQVFINGQLLPEPYQPNEGSYTWGPAKVGPDEYFVLGDNRNNSSDSHSWGMLPEDLIIGKAWFTYWPVSDWGVIPHYDFSKAVSELRGNPASQDANIIALHPNIADDLTAWMAVSDNEKDRMFR